MPSVDMDQAIPLNIMKIQAMIVLSNRSESSSLPDGENIPEAM